MDGVLGADVRPGDTARVAEPGGPGGRLRLVRVDAPTPHDWQIAASTAGGDHLPEQSPAWISAICADGRWDDASRAYRFDDGRTFVLPLVRRRGTSGRLAVLASPPHAWGIGGLLGPELDAGVVTLVVDDLTGLGAARVSVRIDPRHEDAWSAASTGRAVTVPRRGHVIDLSVPPDQLFESLNKSTRKAVRRASRNEVELRVERTDVRLRDHYELYLLSVERWSSRQREPLRLAQWRARRRDSLRKLQRMAAVMEGRYRHVIAYLDGRPAASTIVLLGGTARDTRGALDRDLVGNSGANDLVQWRAIEEAYAFGSRWYNLGESGRSVNLAAFKERFGAVPIDHHEYRFERLPITRLDTTARTTVKRVIGFRDV